MATGLENLKIYNIAKELEMGVYNITQEFPKDERFRSVDQLRRSSSAVTNNIAEAYNKKTMAAKSYVLRDIVISEAEETQSNLRPCAQKRFADPDRLVVLAEKYKELIKATYGFIRFLRSGEPKRSVTE